MGNHMSCMFPAAAQHHVASSSNCINIIKILHTDTGSISEFEELLTAAELMMEHPCQFVCCYSTVISNGHRICPVPAHEELRLGELYILLPMHKLNSRFSTEELAFFSALVDLQQGFGRKPVGGKYSSKASSQSKVAPLPCLTTAAAGAGVSLKHPVGLGQPLHSLCCRSKSWIPKLETIVEVPHVAMAF